jgi:hypothetical protein
VEFDFSQNTKVPDINKVPQDFRPFYKQGEDGQHVLDSDNPSVKSAVATITGLNTALKAARAEAKNKPGAVDLTPLKDFGTDPAAIKQAIDEKVQGLEAQIKGVNVEKIKQDLAKEYAKEQDGLKNRAGALEKQLYQTLVVGAATGAIASEKGDTELLMPFVQKHVKTIETNGQYQVAVVDAQGDIRYSGVTGAPMTVQELVKEMKGQDRYAKLFASEAANGGGAKPGTSAFRPNNAAQVANRQISDMSPSQKIAAGLRKGQFQGNR